ncbi:hypothetical protein LSCM1_06011 [Leishmania martiniquensis]|uniref:Uncharacterized protein n=1 Tax=Leishmania martiniquensis TaxID=1580590 RepID=A0A836KJ33_9TRYP|nr:hypothetical protein LSCM1_01835 [Leishmania martiniquensis]KAG5472505.1 hypothetical protein LSCM1_03906 [Leishmania martiniquensis]KAG5472572.1 hypothetical protein LSCM1_03976 [Leishmania martiniquensis]KAG5478608.1 hypothetical protein LSCM1_06011 [Leishmania martiniquensis]
MLHLYRGYGTAVSMRKVGVRNAAAEPLGRKGGGRRAPWRQRAPRPVKRSC